MREMKDSGVPWIGEIPKNWEISQLKRWVKVNNGKEISEEVNQGDLSAIPVYGSGGPFKYTNSSMYKGEAVLFGRKGTLGKPLYVDDEFWVVDTMYYLTMMSLNPKFCYYLLTAFDWIPFITKTAIPSIVASDIVAQKYPIPSKEEQLRIADFLDTKCAEIDSFLEKTKASIEEYKKLKQSVITDAVTKSIRGERPMKDSGVEWIGEIPTEWKTSRVGLHFEIILGKMLCSEPLGADYTLEKYYCAANVHFSGVDKCDLKTMWFSSSEKEAYLVKEGDLLVVEGGAGAGGSAIVKDQSERIYIQNSIMIVRPKAQSSAVYLRYLLESLVSRGYVDFACNKATIPHFTKDKLGQVPFLLPEEAEQQEIAAYLDEKCAAIDSLIASKEALITELETYKKSIIYEYVTGKKEV